MLCPICGSPPGRGLGYLLAASVVSGRVVALPCPASQPALRGREGRVAVTVSVNVLGIRDGVLARMSVRGRTVRSVPCAGGTGRGDSGQGGIVWQRRVSAGVMPLLAARVTCARDRHRAALNVNTDSQHPATASARKTLFAYLPQCSENTPNTQRCSQNTPTFVHKRASQTPKMNGRDRKTLLYICMNALGKILNERLHRKNPHSKCHNQPQQTVGYTLEAK